MNCSQTEQILHYLPTGPANDANSMQSAREKKFFLDEQ